MNPAKNGDGGEQTEERGSVQSAAVLGQLTWQLPLEWALMPWCPAHSEGGALLQGTDLARPRLWENPTNPDDLSLGKRGARLWGSSSLI